MLGIEVADSQVYDIGVPEKPLGPLAGTQARISKTTSKDQFKYASSIAATAPMIAPLTLPAFFMKRNATAFIAFSDGTLHRKHLQGKIAIQTAMQEVVKFNELAARAIPANTAKPVGDNHLSERGQDIVSQTKTVIRLLALGTAVAIAVNIVKITASGQKLKLPGGIDLSSSYAWAVLAILTTCHVFLTVFLVRQTHLVWRDPVEAQEGAEIVRAVKATGNIFVNGLEAKIEERGGIYFRSAWDQSIWIACLASLLMIVAVLPWRFDQGHLRWASGGTLGALIAVAIALAALNWLAGGTWVVALIELALPKAKATYHHRIDHLFYHDRETPTQTTEG